MVVKSKNIFRGVTYNKIILKKKCFLNEVKQLNLHLHLHLYLTIFDKKIFFRQINLIQKKFLKWL